MANEGKYTSPVDPIWNMYHSFGKLLSQWFVGNKLILARVLVAHALEIDWHQQLEEIDGGEINIVTLLGKIDKYESAFSIMSANVAQPMLPSVGNP